MLKWIKKFFGLFIPKRIKTKIAAWETIASHEFGRIQYDPIFLDLIKAACKGFSQKIQEEMLFNTAILVDEGFHKIWIERHPETQELRAFFKIGKQTTPLTLTRATQMAPIREQYQAWLNR